MKHQLQNIQYIQACDSNYQYFKIAVEEAAKLLMNQLH
jgi:hypothetical protein